MAKQPSQHNGYQQLTDELKHGQPANCYIFYGDERFLLERSIVQLRNLICPEGSGGFNHRQFDGRTVSLDEIEAAVNTYPAFAERTLIEVTDYNMFTGRGTAGSANSGASDGTANKPASRLPGGAGSSSLSADPNGSDDAYGGDDSAGDSFGATTAAATDGAADDTAASRDGKKTASGDADHRLTELICDLPDYVCLVFIFDISAFKPDSRRKNTSAILKHARTVEFSVQSTDRLTKWIVKHFEDAGKRITASDAAYLAFITGGLMYSLLGEIEKVSAYVREPSVTRADIDAVVAPVLDAVAYKLTDALTRREFDTAMHILDELFRMREPAHKIMFAIAVKMRQLLAARVCLDNKLDRKALVEIIALPRNLEFQAGYLMETARKTTLTRCRDYVRLCSEAGYALNSQPDSELRVTELLTQLAFASE